MAEIINFTKARKVQEKAADRAKAAENRIKFGRTKAERHLDRETAAREIRLLDGHARQDDDRK